MATYRFKIVGVHYAVNPDSASSAEETETMHQRTAERLRQWDEKRPSVILIPEPTNPVDVRAVMARIEGARIGYVDKTQLDTLHALLGANGGRPLKAAIESVEAKKHGWMNICLETKEEVCVEFRNHSDSLWEGWTCTLPGLPATDSQFAQMEAEVMLEDAMAQDAMNLTAFAEMERYMNIWLDSSLHDLSNEARLTREEYILRLKEKESQNATLVSKLEKQRTAICGQKRMNLRIGKWWKELLESKEMEQLWRLWAARTGSNQEASVSEIESILRTLPYDLYSFLDDRKLFFSRLYYSHVPRTKYWQVVSLMLLRDRTLIEMQKEEGGNDRSHTFDRESRWEVEEGECNETFTVTIPEELDTPEAKRILAKLQKKAILDADWQPSTLVGWQKGVVAYELTELLGIKHRWVVMARLWKCSEQTLRQYYSKNFSEQKTIDYSKKIKMIIR